MTHKTGEYGQVPSLVKKIAGITQGGPVEYEGAIPDGETWQEGVGGKRLFEHREASLTKELDDVIDERWLCHRTPSAEDR